MTLLAIMLFYYSTLGASASFWAILPGLLIGGVGMGSTMTPMTAAAMSAVPVDKAGVGSAVLNSMRQVGGSLGIAVMGAIVAAGVDRHRLRAGADGGLPARLPRRAARRRGCSRSPARSSPTVAIRKVEHTQRTGGRGRGRAGDRGRMTQTTAAADRRGAAAGGARHRLPRLRRVELPGRDDGGDRARGGHLGADPVPALRLEARPLPRVPRRGLGGAPRAGRDARSRRARTRASAPSPTRSWRSGRRSG